jgi:uncharacterized protein
MDLEKIKQELKSEKYDFLKHIPNIILLTLGGSHAYGTNIKTSDVDIRGICLNTKEEILTMNCRDKPYENKNTDTVIYPLKRIIQLLISCNPNTIEILGTHTEHLFVLTEIGELLRDNVDLFLSQKVSQSFGGYATAQLRRLQNALARDDYLQLEKEKHILDSIKNQLEHFKRNYYNLTKQDINLYTDKSEKVDFKKEIYMDLNLKHYPMRDFKGIYSEMSNVIKNYSSLNHRNNKKDEFHLNKHAMHLIRLLKMGTEILGGNGVNTYRNKDHDLLMAIRNGDYVLEKNGKKDYSEIFKIVDECEKQFQYAVKNTCLPEEPNIDKINELLIDIIQKY